jgi:membrane-bound serine protease (ClpP class)
MMLAIGLLVLGLVLIVGELMFPTIGALGIGGALAILGSIVVAFQEGSQTGVVFLVATAVLVPGAIVLGLKLLPHSPFGKSLVARGASFTDAAAVDRRDRELVGKEGLAENFLRPIGTAMLDGRRVDVQSRGEPIEAGARVRVIEVEGNRVVVVQIPHPPKS